MKTLPRKLAEVEDRDEMLKTLRAEVDKTSATYRAAAAALTSERKAAAAKLAKLAEAQINSLAMKVRFEIAVNSGRRRIALDLRPAGTKWNIASRPMSASP